MAIQIPKSQLVLVAILGALVSLLLGVVVGLLIGRSRTSSPQPPVAASASNESGLGVRRQRVIDLFSVKANGAFRFEMKQGSLHDYLLGTSDQWDGVSLQLSGPPDELQQIGVFFKLKNVGHRVQLQNVLESIFQALRTKADLSQLMKWIDQSTGQKADADVTLTTVIGRHRFILYTARDGSFVLRIEPVLIVTWRRD